MRKHVVKNLVISDKGARSVKTRTHRHGLGRVGEPLTGYLGDRSNGDYLQLPADLKDVTVTLVDFEAPRDPVSGLFPARAGGWIDVGAPDVPAPTTGLEGAANAVVWAVETLEDATIVTRQAEAVADALEHLDAALASIEDGLTLAQNILNEMTGE